MEKIDKTLVRATERVAECIANIGYPVGCGIAPHPETSCEIALAAIEAGAAEIERLRERVKYAEESLAIYDEGCDSAYWVKYPVMISKP